MALRKALQRATELLAECPVGGVCRRRQPGRKVSWTCCGHYRGTHTDSRGLLVKCDFNTSKERMR